MLFQLCSLPKHTLTLLPPGTNKGLARVLADLMAFLMNTVAFNYKHPQSSQDILGVAELFPPALPISTCPDTRNTCHATPTGDQGTHHRLHQTS